MAKSRGFTTATCSFRIMHRARLVRVTITTALYGVMGHY